MSCDTSEAWILHKGADFRRTVLWADDELIYRHITGATQDAPCVLTVPSHGVPDGWPIAITGVVGMTQLNARRLPVQDSDHVTATVVDADTLSLNSIDAQLYSPYESGGAIRYRTPHDLAGYTAEARILAADGTELLSTDSTSGGIVIDAENYRIDLVIPGSDTASVTWTSGTLDLRMTSPQGEIFPPLFVVPLTVGNQ